MEEKRPIVNDVIRLCIACIWILSSTVRVFVFHSRLPMTIYVIALFAALILGVVSIIRIAKR